MRAIVPAPLARSADLHPHVSQIDLALDHQAHIDTLRAQVDVFMALPGGLHTLGAALQWLAGPPERGHDQPMLLIGGADSWGGLAHSLAMMRRHGFLDATQHQRLQCHDSPQGALAWLIHEWQH